MESPPQPTALKNYIQRLKPSATLAINEKSAKLIAGGKKIYRFGLGQSPFPVPEEVIDALRNFAHVKDYLSVKGLWDLRVAVAGFNSRKLGIECQAENVLIGPGSKELIFILQVAFKGDILLLNPSWVSYGPQAALTNRKVHWIPTDQKNGWKVQPSDLEATCQKLVGKNKFLILNYPNNPIGNTYTPEELKRLAAVAREHQVLIVSDEIYGEVHHMGTHVSIGRYYPEGTIISSGLSKWCGAGGWRLGTFSIPQKYDWLLEAMAAVASETFTSVSAPIQFAAIQAFSGSPDIEQYLLYSREILKKVGMFVYQRLRDLNLTMPPPEGGFYLFPDFEAYRENLLRRGIKTSLQLCEILLQETGIALLPGEAFGRPTRELTCRLSYVDFDGQHALAQWKQLDQKTRDANFLNLACPKMVEAMATLASWLEGISKG